MLRIVYVSTAATPQAELPAMLLRARAKNRTLDITGMLIHKDGYFMQVLEGQERPVGELLETIRHDPRHMGVQVLSSEVVSERLFAPWSMGFRDLTDPLVRELPGFARFLSTSLSAAEFRGQAQGGLRLLQRFSAGE